MFNIVSLWTSIAAVKQLTIIDLWGVQGCKNNTHLARTMSCIESEATENYHPTLQFLSPSWSVLPSFSSLFWFCCPQLHRFGSVSLLLSVLSRRIRQLFSLKKSSDKPTVPALHQTAGRVSNWLVNIVEHLPAKEPDIWWRPNQSWSYIHWVVRYPSPDEL